MAKKKAFALRVNEDMLKAIEKWAADEFRSTNGQIEWMLMKALKEAKREPTDSKKDTKN
ncbi:Arc family DNA binding domain-containing protein [Pontimicrobium sp. IMCC45349]|uniref:Arc family DNA binding domain-containing protein n=1 Tax=Pontimicrobium sp. IMCC45349 TaxID=3391574 RepID=UPI00399EF11D